MKYIAQIVMAAALAGYLSDAVVRPILEDATARLDAIVATVRR